MFRELGGRLQRLFASDRFFYAIMIFLGVSATWIAISSLYPMAFDEDFHFGLIKLYSQHWNPFSLVQTPDRDIYGSIVTDPSYLYHYLMSFPYRLLTHLTHSESDIVIVLRLINVFLFSLGVYLYRKLLRASGVSPALTNIVLAMFVLIPVVPMLAGQINYDNLFLPIVAIVLLLALNIRNSVRAGKRIPATQVLWLTILFLLGSVVKYAFLPVVLAVGAYLLAENIIAYRRNDLQIKQFVVDIKKLSRRVQIFFGILFAIGIMLFSQRYVQNLANYHTFVPDCNVVVSEERCLAYGPWGRDYNFAHNKNGLQAKGVVHYATHDWTWGMWQRLFFTLAGPTNNFDTKRPLPIPCILAILLTAIGVLLFLIYGRKALRDYPIFILFLAVSAVYIAALFVQEYQSYVYTVQPVAINGRYLIPFLPLLGAIAAVVYRRAFSEHKALYMAPVFTVVVLLLMLQGGGPITYIMRSNPWWFWHGSFVQRVNTDIQSALRPVIYENYFFDE